MVENAVQNGVEIFLETEVTGLIVKGAEVRRVRTNRGGIEADYVVNAAGLWADRVSAMVGINHFTLHPRKGEYYVFDKKLGSLVYRVLFPAPTPVSKGIVVTPTVDGNVLIGPNAQDMEDKEDVATTPSGMAEVFTGASQLIPPLAEKGSIVITNFCGLRPEPSTQDFIIEAYKEVRGFINVAGMKSPGLTAAPSVAQKVTALLKESGLELREKETFNPHRKPIDRPLRELNLSKARGLIDQDTRYGHVVCRCEHVTEAEILNAIRRGASTLDGVKFRTRAGMGRCQGGFCTPHVIKILARELRIPAERVTKRGGKSRLLPNRVKDLLLRGEWND